MSRNPDPSPVYMQLTTEPGRLILGALTDYGGYIVDDTGSQQGGGALCMEHAVNAELLAAYGYSVAIEDPLTPTQGAPLYWDIVHIFQVRASRRAPRPPPSPPYPAPFLQALAVVANNGPSSPGGGGTPRRLPPPPICGAQG